VVWRRIERRLDADIKERIKRKKERDKRNKERLARGLKPLRPLKREHVLPRRGVRSPDRALRATIGEALVRLRATPVVPEGLYLDDADDARPVSPESQRAAWGTLATKAGVRAAIGAPLTIPRGKETLLERAMVCHVMPDHPAIVRDPSQPLGPEILALIAERAARMATSYRERSGPRRNLALEHFRWVLARAIEARCGEESAGFGWVYERSEPVGLLFHTLSELQPWLPGLADATERQLYDAFLQGRKRRKRSTRQ
jgi:hypothetical protein